MKLRKLLAASVLTLGASIVATISGSTPVLAHDACTNAPDSGPTFNFHDACTTHDDCYGGKWFGNSQSGRWQCDTMFWALMVGSCNHRYNWWDPRRATCVGVANVYYPVVVAAGWYFWD